MSNRGKILTGSGAEVSVDALGVPAGGTTGQVLAKASDDDGDAGWEDAGGGSQPVSALLGIDNGLTVTPPDNGAKPLLWDVLYGSWTFGDPLLAIPAGLGLAFSFDGSDNTITATESGVWAFTLGLGGGTDTALNGVLRLKQGGFLDQGASPPYAGHASVTAELPMAPGDALAPEFDVGTTPNAPVTFYPYMQILRSS